MLGIYHCYRTYFGSKSESFAPVAVVN
jgi:hypothetical protein